jgi:hypothetical protein
MSKLNAFLASVPANGLDTSIKNAPTASPWCKTSLQHFHTDEDSEEEQKPQQQQQQQQEDEEIVKKESSFASLNNKITPFSTFVTSTRNDQHSCSPPVFSFSSTKSNNNQEEDEEHEAYAMTRLSHGGGRGRGGIRDEEGPGQIHRSSTESTTLFKSVCRKKTSQDIGKKVFILYIYIL